MLWVYLAQILHLFLKIGGKYLIGLHFGRCTFDWRLVEILSNPIKHTSKSGCAIKNGHLVFFPLFADNTWIFDQCWIFRVQSISAKFFHWKWTFSVSIFSPNDFYCQKIQKKQKINLNHSQSHGHRNKFDHFKESKRKLVTTDCDSIRLHHTIMLCDWNWNVGNKVQKI